MMTLKTYENFVSSLDDRKALTKATKKIPFIKDEPETERQFDMTPAFREEERAEEKKKKSASQIFRSWIRSPREYETRRGYM